MQNQILPPKAEKRPVTATLHGDTRVDDYAWLRGKEDPEVLAHLAAENEYTASAMASYAELQEQLFEEMKSRILETDLSVPTVKGPWAYFARTEEGKQYAKHCRRPASDAYNETASETVLIDENQLAEGHDFFALGTFEISPDHNFVAYAFDTEGGEVYELHVRDIRTGTDLPDVIEETAGGVAWSTDGGVLFYVVQDEAMRPYQLFRHIMGTESADDTLVYQEDDERFYIGLSESATSEWLFLTIGSQVTTEVRGIPANAPLGEWNVLTPRRQDIEYGVEHHRAANGSERFFIVTNDGAQNFRLCIAAQAQCSAEEWLPAGPEWVSDSDQGTSIRPKLDAIDVFESHLVLYERADGMERIRIIALGEDGSFGEQRILDHVDPVHSVWGLSNPDFKSTSLRFGYSSMVTPSSVYDEDMRTGDRVLRKQQPVLGNFDPKTYVSERVWAVAADGTRVPMSLVRHKDTPVDGTAPGLLYGYGSYEISIDPTFSSFRLSLLDRGLVFAIAHIRGGGEMGRPWYLNGKFFNKRNTFTDFITCAEHLIAEGYVSKDRLVARGGSAGGLLMGASINIRPDLFAGIVAEVPFVDVVNTMLDESLPLTAIEWEEWGNPAEPEYYAYMKSYAPYENVQPVAYPRMLVTAGLNDPRVAYWEPAKWVQRLRDVTTGSKEILLKTEMGAGHGGPSGRYDSWRDEAFVHSFILSCVGLA